MAYKIQAKFGTYHSGLNDEASINKMLLSPQAEKLNVPLVQLAGSPFPSMHGVSNINGDPFTGNDFPFTMFTEGKNNVEYINGDEFTWNVQEPQEKYVAVASSTYSATDKPGVGNGSFYLQFPENYFTRGMVLTNADEVHTFIEEEGVKVGSNWEYKMKLTSADPTEYLPYASFKAGAKWAEMYRPEGEASTGSASNVNFNYIQLKQYLTLFRKDYDYTDYAEQKIIEMSIINQSTGKPSNMWMDYYAWQNKMKFMMEMEMYCKYGQSNYDATGLVHLKNKSKNNIKIGPGLFEQIGNKVSYGSSFSARSMKELISDVFYGIADGTNRVINLYTGTDGLNVFDEAMKSEVAGAAWIKNTDPKSFINGSGMNLTYGGFFSQYKTDRLNRTINVIYDRSFDVGPVAQTGPVNPLTGRPLESSRMVFIDDTLVDGRPNLMMVKRKGFFKTWAVVGGANPPAGYGTAGVQRSSDSATTSVHFMDSKGLVLLRPNTSIDLQRTSI